ADDLTPEGHLDGVEAEAGSSADEEPSSAEKKKFDDMAPGERLNYMKTVVMPTMKPIFQEFDGEEYGEFGCATCHGSGAKDGNFEMPSAELPALDQAEMDEHPEMTKFMMEKVTPKMADLMGEAPGPEGFGCFDCHTKKD